MAFLTWKNEGIKSLFSAVKLKLSTVTITNDHYEKFNFSFSENDIINGIFQPKKIKFSIDHELRNFLEYAPEKIKNLFSYPKISIIILAYNQTMLLEKNIGSIKKSTYKNFEIIVVTNNHDPDSDMRKFLQTLDCKIHVYENDYSFSKMNNFGASKSTGDYLIFLNDDVEIKTPTWIESFLSVCENYNVGVIGAKLLFSDMRLQESGCIFWQNGNAWNYGRESDPRKPEFNFIRDVDYCSGCCLFVDRKAFELIGGFDSSYDPAYAEDADLCFSLREKGYRVLYQPAIEVIHHEGMTQGTKTTQGIKSYQVENLKKFARKWKTTLDKHRTASNENGLFERNRKSGMNILFIDHYVSEPDRDSGSLRAFRLLGILSKMNHKITFWPDNLKKSEPYTSELQQKGIEVMYKPINFSKFLEERKNLYDVVILSRPHIAIKYIDLIRKKMQTTIAATFLIVFREALEAGLIIGIILTALSRLNARHYFKHVALSIVLALIASVLAAWG